MAIVLTSQEKNGKKLIVYGGVLVVVILLGVLLFMFLPGLLNTAPAAVPQVSFNKPDVIINLGVLESEKVKNLQPFTPVQTEFTYTVKTAAGKQVSGNISAASQDDAQSQPQAAGYTVITVSATPVGRSDPFVSY